MSLPLARKLSVWSSQMGFDDLPSDVVDATKFRVLDVIGLALAGATTQIGRASRSAAAATSGPGPCLVLGTRDRLGVGAAAFANASAAQALEFDDTHNGSIVHMSSPSVAAALAVSETVPVSGRDLIAAVAVGNEISCRVGNVAEGEFHKRGLHPTGLFAPFGVAYLAGRLFDLAPDQMTNAAGIVGSFASGILECWVDGTESKFLHSGWAAQSGITAAALGRAGMTGPSRVLEGRFGFFASHLQDPTALLDFARVEDQLGIRWESRNASFKPFPAAHVLHPYIDAALRLRKRHGIRPADIAEVRCPVASFIVGIVCEPAAEKQAPATGSHGRVSLPYTLAEALVLGKLGKDAYGPDSIGNREILDLAKRVRHVVDPQFPGPGRFKGAVEITLTNGTTFAEVEEYNRGSKENPMHDDQLREKFDENAKDLLSESRRNRLTEMIATLEQLTDVSALVDLAAGPDPAPDRSTRDRT